MARLHIPIQLRWGDFDAYGHVNNAEMLHLLEEARIQAFWAADDGDAEPGATGLGSAVLDGRPGAATMTLIARQEVEYLAPVPYWRRPLEVELWLGHLGGASLEVCYEVFAPAGIEPRTLYTRAATTIVLLDTATERPRRITDAERAVWEPYLEPAIEFRRRASAD